MGGVTWAAVFLGSSVPGKQRSWGAAFLGSSIPEEQSSWAAVFLGRSVPGQQSSWEAVEIGFLSLGFMQSLRILAPPGPQGGGLKSGNGGAHFRFHAIRPAQNFEKTTHSARLRTNAGE